eukprot:m.284501 g.284501  ORF g.284501 m.284501 type:complete len:1109 (-) comp15763_c0_seq1:408-3734(-)
MTSIQMDVLKKASARNLHQAAREGDLDEAKEILAMGADGSVSLSSGMTGVTGITSQSEIPFVDRRDETGQTALHYACRNKQLDMMRLLLDAKADPEAPGEEDMTPCHVIARYADASAFEVLFEYIERKRQTAAATAQDEYGSTPMHFACEQEETSALLFLINLGVNVEIPDRVGATPLHWACLDGQKEIVAALIENGADIQAKDAAGATPLQMAASNGHFDVMRLLLARSDEPHLLVTECDNHGMTSLQYAVQSGVKAAVRVLFEYEIETNHQSYDTKRTALHIAAKDGFLDIVKLLVSKGCKRYAKDSFKQMPVHRAAKYGRTDVVEFLLTGKSARAASLNACGNDGMTPLLLASMMGHANTVQALLEMGANIMITDKFGKSALYLAIECGDVPTCKALIQAAASADSARLVEQDDSEDTDADTASILTLEQKSLITLTDKYDLSPMHVAASLGHVAVIDMLKTAGASTHPTDDSELTPLHYAVMHGHFKVVKYLLKDHTLTQDRDEKGQSALHLVCRHGYHDMIPLFLSAGADINAKDDAHQTPLVEAAMAGKRRCAFLLLENEAHVSVRDKTGMTALHHAANNGYSSVVELLLERGADISAQDQMGATCLDLAAKKGHIDAVKAIINHPHCRLVYRRRITPKHVSSGADEDYLGFSPLMTLMTYLPQEAATVLSQQVSTSHVSTSPDYEIQYNFELIDGPNCADSPRFTPISLMVKLKRPELLLHPLVDALLKEKWKRFGSFAYYSNLVLYMLFVTFLTTFIALRDTSTFLGYSDWSVGSKISAGYTQFYVAYGICTELFQLRQFGRTYFNWRNLLDWLVYITAAMLVSMPQFSKAANLEDNWNMAWLSGSVAVFLAWMNLLVFVRRFGGLGIYVLMFTNTLFTVLKVMFVFSIFVIAFALSFHVMLNGQDNFKTAASSISRTFVMMTGEYDFDSIFTGECLDDDTQTFDSNCFRFASLMYPMFVLFIILMQIILMNLLIGLAVGDIEKVRAEAKVSRQAIKAEYIMASEPYMSFIRNPVELMFKVRPNDKKIGFVKKLFQKLFPDDDPTSELDEKPLVEELRVNTRQMKVAARDMRADISRVSRRAHNHTHALRQLAEKLQISA